MMAYEIEETAFKEWLKTNVVPATPRSSQDCVIAKFLDAQGLDYDSVFPLERGYAVRIKGEAHPLPAWATKVAGKFDRRQPHSIPKPVSADELREEFA